MTETIETSAPPAIDLSQLASLIKDMVREEVQSLRAEIDTLKQATPAMRPMEKPDDPSEARRAAIAGLKKGEEASGVLAQLAVTGRKDPSMDGTAAVGARKARFSPGQRVKIRADVRREGFPQAGDPFPEKWETDIRGRKRVTQGWRYWSRLFKDVPETGGTFPRDVVWGDVLSLARCKGEGTVGSKAYWSHGDEWKYKRVRIKGLTTEWGDGFYEFELMAA